MMQEIKIKVYYAHEKPEPETGDPGFFEVYEIEMNDKFFTLDDLGAKFYFHLKDTIAAIEHDR